MLTCKSLFGLGYRGERLIEPLILLVVESPFESRRLVGPARSVRAGARLRCRIAGNRPESQATKFSSKRGWMVGLIASSTVKMLRIG